MAALAACAPDPGAEPACTVERRAYLIDDLRAPETQSQAMALALNVDDDPQGRVDNLLGAVRSGFISGSGFDLEAPLRETIATGQLRWVVTVETCAEDAGGAGWARVRLERDGAADPAALPALGERSSDGRIVARDGAGGVPAAALFLFQPAGDAVPWLPGAGLVVDLTPDGAGGIAGRIGAGLDVRDDAFLPLWATLAEQVTAAVAADPGCPDACASLVTEYAAKTLDRDGDGVVTAEETAGDDYLRALFAPDVDLFDRRDGADRYAPRTDGEADHISVGVAFHAVVLE